MRNSVDINGDRLQNDTCYFGAIVGRVANRIGGAKFTLNGTVYKLDANEGTNILHGTFFIYSETEIESPLLTVLVN